MLLLFSNRCEGGFAMRPVQAAILTLVISCCVFGQTYTINTFAGGGLPVNVPGTSASLHLPVWSGAGFGPVAVDGAGNLFFADDHNAVFRLDGATHTLTLVAGNGTPGFSGDDGPWPTALLVISASLAIL